MSIWKKLFGGSPASASDSGIDNVSREDTPPKVPVRKQFHHIFVNRDRVVIPTVARTTNGHWLDVEPVVVLPLSDPEAIRAALTNLIAQGNPEIPSPQRGEYHEPVSRCAGLRNWSAFAKKFDAIAFTRNGDEFTRSNSPRAAQRRTIQLEPDVFPPRTLSPRFLDHILSPPGNEAGAQP